MIKMVKYFFQRKIMDIREQIVRLVCGSEQQRRLNLAKRIFWKKWHTI